MKNVVVFLACGLLLALIGRADAVDFPNFSLPVYPGATNQKAYLDKPEKGVKATTYRISAAFPPRDLTEFYNKEMMERGFRKYHDPLESPKQFEWITFNSNTGDWEPTRQAPARYLAKWCNKKEDQLVWLVIDFKPSQKEQKNGTASVSVHVVRYSTYLKEIDEINKKLDEIKKSTHNKEDSPAKRRR